MSIFKCSESCSPFGMVMPGRSFSAGDAYRYGFNGMEKDDEMKGNGNHYDLGLRNYDPRLGRMFSIDPRAPEYAWQTTYAYHRNNFVSMIDYLGGGDNDDEFDKDGNRISGLGGDKVNFYHQENGDTRVECQLTCATNTITGGEKLIRGYSERDSEVSAFDIGQEWDLGYGPVNSMFSSFNGETSGPFSSLKGSLSLYTSKARLELLNSEEPKGKTLFSTYNDFNPLIASGSWEQMIGQSNISWYKLGDDQVLFLMTDSKTWESALYRSTKRFDHERKFEGDFNGNTRQTYIWTESILEIKNHIQVKSEKDKADIIRMKTSYPVSFWGF